MKQLEFFLIYPFPHLSFNLHQLCAWAMNSLTYYKAFSLTWLASMQIYWNKRKRLHKKGFNSHMSGLGHQHGRRLIVLNGTPIWPPWRHVKTLYKAFSRTWPAALQIYWKNSKFLRKKKVQLIRDFIGSPTWPPFPCFEMTISWTWRHVKILYSDVFVFLYKIAES